MPWVSLFDVLPDAVFRNGKNNAIPVVDGRVTLEFPDIDGGGGEEYAYLELNAPRTGRVRLREIVAYASGSTPGSSSASLYRANGDTDQSFDNVNGTDEVEFQEAEWNGLEVYVYRPGV